MNQPEAVAMIGLCLRTSSTRVVEAFRTRPGRFRHTFLETQSFPSDSSPQCSRLRRRYRRNASVIGLCEARVPPARDRPAAMHGGTTALRGPSLESSAALGSLWSEFVTRLQAMGLILKPLAGDAWANDPGSVNPGGRPRWYAAIASTAHCILAPQ